LNSAGWALYFTEAPVLASLELVLRRQLVEAYLRETIGKVVGAPASKIALNRPLSELGMDSLMAIELKNRIEADLGATVPMVKFLEGPSVRELSAFLAEQLLPLLSPMRRNDATLRRHVAAKSEPTVNSHGQAAVSTNGHDNVDAGHLLSQLDDLSDSEVDSLLSELCDAEKGD
jgi:acyl carrier protein